MKCLYTTTVFKKKKAFTLRRGGELNRGKNLMKAFLVFLGIVSFGFAIGFAKLPHQAKDIKGGRGAVRHHVRAQRVAREKRKAVTLYSGSLHDNIARIATEYGWKRVVWKPEEDFRWVGKTHLKNQPIYSVFSTVLKGYPLQAVFYKGNHVLVITARNI